MSDDMGKLHEEFMNECRYVSALSSETLRGYQHSFDLLMKIMPTLTIDTICTKTITEFFRRLGERERTVGKGQTRKGIRKTTVATYRSKLNKFFVWLESRGHIKENPFRKMEYPSVQYEDRKYLKKEPMERIFTALVMGDTANQLVRKRNLVIFSLLLYCGLRKGELLGLRVYDVDLGRRILMVRGETSKSKRDRTIPINTKVFMALQDYLGERKKHRQLSPSLLVSNNCDQAFTVHGLKHLVAKLKSITGVNFHVHQLRHTFAVNLINNGTDIAKVKQLMGHTDIRMTMAYLRCLPTKSMRADVEALELDNLV